MPDREFGRIQSPIDNRDWDLDDFIPEQPFYRIAQDAKWDFPCTVLDQENTTHCVGFSMAHFGINLPTFTQYTKQDAHDFYYMCKEVDGYPKQEDGTTVRSAARVLQDAGAINHYAFAKDIESIRWWLLNRGPLIVGTIWTENMMTPDAEGRLDITGFILGGHAYLINEWRKEGIIGIKNSWGPGWGNNGKAYITVDDFKALLEYGGEALACVELQDYKVKRECWFIKLVRRIIELFTSQRA
jgi:hypothetical protein